MSANDTAIVIARQRVGAKRRPMTGSSGRSSIPRRQRWNPEATAYWIPAAAGYDSRVWALFEN